MGRYINWQDVVNRYPDAAKIAGAEGVASSWLYHAEYEVDARLAPKYVTPFVTSPAPALVQDLAIDLTYYKATMRQKGSDVIYNYIKDRFEAIITGAIAVPDAMVAGTLAMFNRPDFQSAFGYDDPVEWRPSEDDLDESEERRG